MENITGLRIKECRNDLKLTQSQLGDIVHVTKQSVSKWEKGTNIPEPTILKQLASLFNCSVDYLLGETNVKKDINLFSGAGGISKEVIDKIMKLYTKNDSYNDNLDSMSNFSILLEEKLKEANLYNDNMSDEEKVELANKILDILKLIKNK